MRSGLPVLKGLAVLSFTQISSLLIGVLAWLVSRGTWAGPHGISSRAPGNEKNLTDLSKFCTLQRGRESVEGELITLPSPSWLRRRVDHANLVGAYSPPCLRRGWGWLCESELVS